jgi:ParB/RepB/Spo0J family partition protein
VLEHTSKHDYVLLTAARTPDGTWVGGSLWRHALGTVNNNLLKNNVKFATSKEAVQAEANRILSLGTAEKLTPNARRILEHFRGPSLPLATEPDMLPAPAPAPLQEEPALPWLDCDGNELHEGDKATVLPDVSKRLSGKLVKVLGEYDPQKKSVQVEPVGWEGEGFGILLCYLRRLPVLGENLEEPFDYTTLPHKEEVRAEQDQERAARRQEPVAAFEVAGQAAHEAAQVAAPEPHRIGWAHKDGSQMNHHYDAQGATACGYKRKAGELHFAGEPDKLPRWQRCEKCDEQLVPLAPEPAAAPAPITSADIEEAVDTPTATTAPVYTPTKMKLVPLADIVVTSNTRKVFDETALAELAESIKAQGVIAPITVRLHAGQPGTFELVAGERRYRASKLAEQVTIPAVIRTLTDREFLEVQLLENLQRVDVRPADEASAFSKLLGSNFSAEEIAQRVGKPVKFVLQRAKLVALIPFWMELLEADRLPLVAAHELARLPAHSQVVVKKWFESSHTWDLKQAKPLEASTIRHGINQEVMRQLSGAAFPKEDATLCPAAGPCTTCPKNSANSRGLFEEAGTDAQAGKCLDAVCFGQKKDAFLARRKKEFAGTDVPLISTSYASPPAGALGYKFYDRAKEGRRAGADGRRLGGGCHQLGEAE